MMKRLAIMSLVKAILVIALFICVDASAQKQDMDVHFSAVRNNQPTASFVFTDKKEEQYIKPLSVYLRDTVPSVRVEAYYLLNTLGQRTKQKALRKKVVSLLIAGWHDKDRGIHRMVDDALIRFQQQDFDRAAKDSIKSRLQNLPDSPGKLFKLIGFLDMREVAPQIKAYAEQTPPLKNQDRWAAYTALARLGDQQAIDMILNRVRAVGVNDDVVYELFPLLVYTRTYRAIHYLEEVLYNNDNNCTSPNPNAPQKMTCAYRVMELLAPAIKDYPLTVGPLGDLMEDDYTKALEKTRAWFKQKNGNYEIIRDTF